MKMKCLALAALLIATTASATAWKDGPFVGYHFAGDVEDPGLVLGWQAAYEFNPYSSVELLGSWHEDSTVDGLSFDVWSVALTGRVGFMPHRSTRVYGGAGFGYYVLHADNEQVRRETVDQATGSVEFVEVQFDKDFGGHAAAGAEVRLSERWELFGELRYVFLETEARYSVAADGSDTMTTREDFPYNFAVLRLGLNYRF